MPTYQYACTECGHGFEAVQSFTDDALTDCPQCQGKLRKVFNSVGIVFKGSGFYRTDSRDKKGSEAKSDSGSGGEGTKDKPSTDKKSTDKSTAGSSASSTGDSKTATSSTTGSAA